MSHISSSERIVEPQPRVELPPYASIRSVPFRTATAPTGRSRAACCVVISSLSTVIVLVACLFAYALTPTMRMSPRNSESPLPTLPTPTSAVNKPLPDLTLRSVARVHAPTDNLLRHCHAHVALPATSLLLTLIVPYQFMARGWWHRLRYEWVVLKTNECTASNLMVPFRHGGASELEKVGIDKYLRVACFTIANATRNSSALPVEVRLNEESVDPSWKGWLPLSFAVRVHSFHRKHLGGAKTFIFIGDFSVLAGHAIDYLGRPLVHVLWKFPTVEERRNVVLLFPEYPQPSFVAEFVDLFKYGFEEFGYETVAQPQNGTLTYFTRPVLHFDVHEQVSFKCSDTFPVELWPRVEKKLIASGRSPPRHFAVVLIKMAASDAHFTSRYFSMAPAEMDVLRQRGFVFLPENVSKMERMWHENTASYFFTSSGANVVVSSRLFHPTASAGTLVTFMHPEAESFFKAECTDESSDKKRIALCFNRTVLHASDFLDVVSGDDAALRSVFNESRAVVRSIQAAAARQEQVSIAGVIRGAATLCNNIRELLTECFESRKSLTTTQVLVTVSTPYLWRNNAFQLRRIDSFFYNPPECSGPAMFPSVRYGGFTPQERKVVDGYSRFLCHTVAVVMWDENGEVRNASKWPSSISLNTWAEANTRDATWLPLSIAVRLHSLHHHDDEKSFVFIGEYSALPGHAIDYLGRPLVHVLWKFPTVEERRNVVLLFPEYPQPSFVAEFVDLFKYGFEEFGYETVAQPQNGTLTYFTRPVLHFDVHEQVSFKCSDTFPVELWPRVEKKLIASGRSPPRHFAVVLIKMAASDAHFTSRYFSMAPAEMDVLRQRGFVFLPENVSKTERMWHENTASYFFTSSSANVEISNRLSHPLLSDAHRIVFVHPKAEAFYQRRCEARDDLSHCRGLGRGGTTRYLCLNRTELVSADFVDSTQQKGAELT